MFCTLLSSAHIFCSCVSPELMIVSEGFMFSLLMKLFCTKASKAKCLSLLPLMMCGICVLLFAK